LTWLESWKHRQSAEKNPHDGYNCPAVDRVRPIVVEDLVLSQENKRTRGQSNLTKSASQGAHSPVRGHPRGSKVVPLNSWGRVSY